MLPDPLHPAIVHLPLGLALVLPVIAIVLLVSIERGAFQPRTWVLMPLLHMLLCGAIFFAQQTGEAEESRVERIVDHDAIELHEERAEVLEITGYIALAVSALGLFGGKLGTASRIIALACSIVVAGAAVATGGSGGELVYKHGAAGAYTSPEKPK